MVRLINSYGKDEASYITYKEGEPLPVNPFYIVDKITNGKIEFLIDFIWLLWGLELGADWSRLGLNLEQIGADWA